MPSYNQIVICGPFGAPLEEFARQLASDLSAKLISAEPYECYNEDESTWVIHEDELIHELSQGKEQTIVYGHFLLSNKTILERMDAKIFMEQDADSCIATIMHAQKQQFAIESKLLEKVIKQYEQIEKPANDNHINPSKKHADIIVPAKNGYSKAVQSFLFSLAVKKEERSLQYQSKPGFFKPQASFTSTENELIEKQQSSVPNL